VEGLAGKEKGKLKVKLDEAEPLLSDQQVVALNFQPHARPNMSF